MQGSDSVELMTHALERLVDALRLLDEAEAPGYIGAHVDLARERLSRSLELARATQSMDEASGRPAGQLIEKHH